MTPHDPQSKKSLRRFFQAQAAQVSPAERAAASVRIRLQLHQSPLWARAGSILFFAARSDEPDIWPLVDLALREGKRISFPRYRREDDSYHAALVSDPAQHLAPGAFGIIEPLAVCPPYPLNQLDLVLVPGLAFTAQGVRLGHGKGYYDRLLAQVTGVTCGLAFDWQMAFAVPFESHDIRLSYVLTQTGWHPGTPRDCPEPS